jgi:hypothetical protein
MTSFASKMTNKRMLEAQTMRDQLKPTAPYEGGLQQQQYEEFKSKEAGRVTFKIKQPPAQQPSQPVSDQPTPRGA